MFAFRGRVKHGRHFTFKSILTDIAITFVASTVTGTFVTNSSPFASRGSWLQVLINDTLASQMSSDLNILSQSPEEISFPKTFTWEHHNLAITITAD